MVQSIACIREQLFLIPEGGHYVVVNCLQSIGHDDLATKQLNYD